MKFARLGPPGGEQPVVVDNGVFHDLSPLTADIDAAFLASSPRERVLRALGAGDLPEFADTAGLRRGAPVARPGKVVCIGLNYRDHAIETGAPLPAEPIVFMKDPMTVIGPDDEVLIPRRSGKTDWEVELAVVIGRTVRYCESAESALTCVAGYAISHDVSEREFQLERGGQWDKGKSCETFNPLGPWLVTPDEIDPADLRLTLAVNGEVRQDGSTADMIFPVGEIVRALSQYLVLYPGDVVNTGTPAGVALAGHHPYLRPGDVVDVAVTGLGRQRQTIGAA